MTFEFKPGAHLIPSDRQCGPIKTFSFSSLTRFEKCPYAVYISKVLGYKEPAGPAADRGTLIHQSWEDYITGRADVLANGGKKPNLRYAEELRELYAKGMVEVEGEWCFDVDWNIVEPGTPEVWGVFKLDVFVLESETSARIIDHKSGRSFGNEIKHGEQGMFYAIAALCRYPNLEYVTTEFNYVDEGKVSERASWRRQELGIFLPRLTKRALVLTTTTEFPPQPSAVACKWCRYKDEVRNEETGEPICKWGIVQ